MASVSGPTKSFVLPLPSLTLSDTGATDLSAILSAHTLAYTSYRNLPATYHLGAPVTGGFDFTPHVIPIYSTTGSIDQLTREL
jgi:hypothetical protein